VLPALVLVELKPVALKMSAELLPVNHFRPIAAYRPPIPIGLEPISVTVPAGKLDVDRFPVAWA